MRTRIVGLVAVALVAALLLSPLTALAGDGDFVWAKQMGGTEDDEGYGIAVDAAGNVYTTGYFAGTADFDPGPGTCNLTSAGAWEIFVSKLSAPYRLYLPVVLKGYGMERNQRMSESANERISE